MSSSRFLVLAFAAALAVAVGCQHDDKDNHQMKGSSSNAAMMDACPHCPGVQTATADGKCPVCGAQVVQK